MKLVDYTCKEFCELTASSSPFPGGGGVSALVSALAACLGNMVGELTVGKEKYADVEERLRMDMEEITELSQRLLKLVDVDKENFEPLAKAYKIPKGTPGRDELMEECLKKAIQAPLEVFNTTARIIELSDNFARNGSTLMISDAASSAVLAKGALEAAAINVKVNTRFMKDRSYARDLDDHVGKFAIKYSRMADDVFYYVWTRLTPVK